MGCCACLQQNKLLGICGFRSRNESELDEKASVMLSVPRTSSVTPSETGRPKVALSRGRSLMDWIRLTASRSTTPKVKPGVDHVELGKHTSVNDCWVLLGERVYDMTEYLAFHPGGVEQLMRAAGTDGTDLFNEYHAWVNYDTMLKSCFIGAFNGDKSRLRKPEKQIGEEASTGTEGVGFEIAGIRSEVNSDGQLQLSSSKWLELRDENISLEYRENKLRLLLHFPSSAKNSLQWTDIPVSIFVQPFRINIDEGTISLQCKEGSANADIAKRWSSGIYRSKLALEYRNCEITEMCNITHDMCSIILRMPPFCRLMVPIGHHVLLRICVNGSLIERRYTPVRMSEDGQFISFMIKFYKDGVFTTKLHKKQCGHFVEVSDPLGCFNASDCADIVLMLAAGTGLAPMLRLSAVRLKNNKMTTVILFNKKTEDIIPDEYFKKCDIPLGHPLLKIIHCLSEPESKWNGEKGLISKELLLKYIDESAGQTGYRIFICGPDPFVDLAAKLLTELEIPQKSIHIFQG